MWLVTTCQLPRETGQALDAFFIQITLFPQQAVFELAECANGQLDSMAKRFAVPSPVFDQAVEQFLHAPGEITDFHCTNHATAAFQRVEAAPEFPGSPVILAVLQPDGQLLS